MRRWNVFLIFLLGFTPFIGVSQKISRFEGKVPLVNGDSAEVRYGYYESRGQRVLQGNYQFEATSSQQEDSITFEKIIWSGAFNKNKKEGPWNYQYQNHHVKIDEIEEFKPRSTLTSQYSILDARYDEGLATGKWTFSKNAYVQGVKTSTLEEASFAFNKGVLSDVFEWIDYKGTSTKVKGKFDENGFLHEVWEFTYPEDSITVRETRVYEHGFLLTLVKATSTGDTLNSIVYQDVFNTLKLLPENQEEVSIHSQLHPLLFDMGYHADAGELTLQKRGNALLQNSVREFLFLDTAFRETTKRVYGSARFQYLVTKKDVSDLSVIRKCLDSIQTDLASIKNKNFFELSNQHSDSLAWKYEFVQRYSSRLKSLLEMADFMETPAYRFTDPGIYLNHYAGFLHATDSIRYNFADEAKLRIIPYAHHSITSVTDLKNRVEEEMLLVRQIVTDINVELKTVLQSYQLQKLDSIILDTKAEVEDWYDHVTDPLVTPYLEIFRRRFLTSDFNRMKREYANSSTFDDKLGAGYDILNFLGSLKEFPVRLEYIYQMRDSIAMAYTESRLDPYTFNYIDIKVKRRLYEKAAEELFLWMMKNMSEALKVEEVEEHLTAVEQLQKRLLKLRTENTVQIEKQIRPKSTPDEIRKIIGV